MSKVSVIIATYNYGNYLPDALRSLQNQTFTDWECIVVDDGSTDETGKIVSALTEADSRIIYLRQSNQGVSGARNAGLALVKGEFIQFLDGDDMLQPRKLEVQVNYLTANKNCDLVCSDFIHVREASEMNTSTGELPEKYKRNLSAKELLENLLKGNFIRINTAMLRSSVIKRVGTFHAPLRSVEDWDFWLRSAASGAEMHFVTGEDTHAVIRQSSAGLSKDVKTMKRHYVAVLQRLYYSGKVSGMLRFRVLMRAAFNTSLFWISGQPSQLDEIHRAGFKAALFCWGVLLLPVAVLYKIKG